MIIGRLKWFNTAKGFGFISREDGNGKDIFLHASEVNKNPALGDLAEGTVLQFDIQDAPRGPKAINVTKAA